MAKTASQVAQKFVERASAASSDYVSGAESTSKDQAANAIAASGNYASQVQAAITRGAYAKGLSRSGKQGWLAGIKAKGGERFAGGVSASASKYATNSAKYDSARNAAASLPRGTKGSEQNLARVKAVVTAQRQVKIS
jgi:hypothetical protein